MAVLTNARALLTAPFLKINWGQKAGDLPKLCCRLINLRGTGKGLVTPMSFNGFQILNPPFGRGDWTAFQVFARAAPIGFRSPYAAQAQWRSLVLQPSRLETSLKELPCGPVFQIRTLSDGLIQQLHPPGRCPTVAAVSAPPSFGRSKSY